MNGVAIVGPGRVGQALGKLLAQAGFPVRLVVARELQAARRAVRFIGGGRAIALACGARELSETDVILLTLSDSALPVFARDFARRFEWRGKIVLHTCGSLPSSVLGPLKRQGASVGSMHPFQTIPSREAGVRNLMNCYWGLEGDGRALDVARRWVKALKGASFAVRANRKTGYHLAAFLVCPAVVTLMDRSLHLLRQAGVPDRIARPMLGQFVAETARNAVDLGPRHALTGPAVRGDWVTIRRHLSVLRKQVPSLIPIYATLLRDMLRLAGRSQLRPSLE